MAKIPLKIRTDIRDLWEKEDCPAQESIAALRDLLGLPVTIQLEPLIIWSELQKFYPDQSTFVPSITSVIKTWTDCLASRLADDSNAAWTEQFLEHVNQSGRNMKARVETRAGSQVKTEQAKSGATFVIGIPESSPPYRNASAFFMAELEKLFTQSSNQTTSAPKQGAEDEDWAAVTLPSRTGGQGIDVAPTAIPVLDEIPRPETLFATQTPYHLIVKVVQNGIVVQGSHQASLELLAAYLEKYTRAIENITVKRPILKYEFQTSPIGYGALFDSLTIMSGDARSGWANINPVLILSFIESVLGYSPVMSGSSESQWYFKRDVGFKE